MKRILETTIMAGALAAWPAAAPAQAPAAAAPGTVPSALEAWTVDRAHTDTSFQIPHLITKVRRRVSDFEGALQLDRARPESSSVEFKIKAASITTDNERRDNHLRSADFFDVANHPEIAFKSSKVVARSQDRFDVTGVFTMRGVSKEIRVPVTFLRTPPSTANSPALNGCSA